MLKDDYYYYGEISIPILYLDKFQEYLKEHFEKAFNFICKEGKSLADYAFSTKHGIATYKTECASTGSFSALESLLTDFKVPYDRYTGDHYGVAACTYSFRPDTDQKQYWKSSDPKIRIADIEVILKEQTTYEGIRDKLVALLNSYGRPAPKLDHYVSGIKRDTVVKKQLNQSKGA